MEEAVIMKSDICGKLCDFFFLLPMILLYLILFHPCGMKSTSNYKALYYISSNVEIYKALATGDSWDCPCVFVCADFSYWFSKSKSFREV